MPCTAPSTCSEVALVSGASDESVQSGEVVVIAFVQGSSVVPGAGRGSCPMAKEAKLTHRTQMLSMLEMVRCLTVDMYLWSLPFPVLLLNPHVVSTKKVSERHRERERWKRREGRERGREREEFWEERKWIIIYSFIQGHFFALALAPSQVCRLNYQTEWSKGEG